MNRCVSSRNRDSTVPGINPVNNTIPGNTRSRCYLITDYNLDTDWEWAVEQLGVYAACGQIEEGAEGHLHWQVCIYFQNQVYYYPLMAQIRELELNVHLEPSRLSSLKDVSRMMHYCHKPIKDCECDMCNKDGVAYEDTRFIYGDVMENWFKPKITIKKKEKTMPFTSDEAYTFYKRIFDMGMNQMDLWNEPRMMKWLRMNQWMGMASHKYAIDKARETLPLGPLLGWQEQVLSELEEPFNNRRFWWVWSNTPGVGKNFLKSCIIVRFSPSVELPYEKFSEMKQVLQLIADCGGNVKCIVITIPREEPVTKKTLKLLEHLIDGKDFAATGMFGKAVTFKAHVVVLSNSPWTEEMQTSLPREVRVICADPQENPNEEDDIHEVGEDDGC